MKKLILFIFAALILCAYTNSVRAQLTLYCSEFTTVGSDTANYSVTDDPSCALCGFGQNEVPWTGSGCSGTLVSTVNGSTVTELILAYTSVNANDYATISIDGGGVMTLEGTYMDVNGVVIGPYNCTGSFGDVYLKVKSTLPFSTVTLLNTGCTSGWVIQCPAQISNAGEDNTITVCDTIIELFTLNGFSDNGGSWTEVSSSGQFNNGTNEFSSTGLNGNTYTFEYLVDICGPADAATINIIVEEDSICNPVILPPIDTTDNAGPINVFSPNDDGVNDTWYIYELENYPLNEVQIYNRWGNEVRKFINYDNDIIIWDGTNANGKGVPTGTYYFIINTTGVVNKSGWVQLVR